MKVKNLNMEYTRFPFSAIKGAYRMCLHMCIRTTVKAKRVHMEEVTSVHHPHQPAEHLFHITCIGLHY
jgi:hypothetical protein